MEQRELIRKPLGDIVKIKQYPFRLGSAANGDDACVDCFRREVLMGEIVSDSDRFCHGVWWGTTFEKIEPDSGERRFCWGETLG